MLRDVSTFCFLSDARIPRFQGGCYGSRQALAYEWTIARRDSPAIRCCAVDRAARVGFNVMDPVTLSIVFFLLLLRCTSMLVYVRIILRKATWFKERSEFRIWMDCWSLGVRCSCCCFASKRCEEFC